MSSGALRAAWEAAQGKKDESGGALRKAWESAQTPTAPPISHSTSDSWGGDDADTSTFGNVSRSVLQGATFGAGNKIVAGGNAVLDAMRGGKFGESYKARLAAERSAEAQFGKQHPIANLAGELAGGVGSMIASGGSSAPAQVAKVGRLARMGKAAWTGAKIGGVSGAINDDGGVVDRLKAGATHAAVAAPLAAVSVPLMEGAGAIASKLKIPQGVGYLADKAANVLPAGSSMRNALERYAGSVGPRGQAATQIGERVAMDDAAGHMPTQSPSSVPTLAVDRGGSSLEGLAKGVVRRPGPGGTTIRTALAERDATMRPSVSSSLAQETGVPADAGMSPVRAALKARSSQADQLYTAARKATEGQPVESPTLDEIMQTPAGKAAFSWAKAQKGNRGSPLPTVGTPTPVALTIRDPKGRLRADLSKVDDDALDEEWRRLAELNSKEEALHGGVQDSHYRNDYEELPRTEKFGRKGQEDLPDADGMVDAEVLAADNKIVKDFNKSIVVRAARKKAMERIDAEIRQRPVPGTDDVSFDFGSNVSASGMGGPPKEVPDPETLHYMKQALAKMARLGMNDGAGGTTATQAQGVLNVWGKIRDELPDVWRQADDAFAEKSRNIDLMNQGRNIFRTSNNPAGRAEKAVHRSFDATEARIASASPEGQQSAQTGAGMGAHSLWNRAGNSVKSPGRVFNASPERTSQLEHAFPSPDAASRFQGTVKGWDDVAQRSQRITGGSDTFANQAEEAQRGGMSSAIGQVSHGRIAGALRALMGGASDEVATKSRQQLDAEIAKVLSSRDPQALQQAMTSAQFRQRLQDMLHRGLGGGAALETRDQ